MINVFGWLTCGVLVGIVGIRMSRMSGLETIGLSIFAGVLGALGGGIVPLIYDTRPLNALSVSSLALAIIGAVALVTLTQVLLRRVSE